MIVVSCSDERNIHLWDLQACGGFSGAPLPPTAVLVHPGRPSADGLSVVRVARKATSKRAVYHVCATGEGGAAFVWRYKRGGGGGGGEEEEEGMEEEEGGGAAASSAPLRPGCAVRFNGPGARGERVGVLSARLVAGDTAAAGGGALAAAAGEAAAPVLVVAVGPPGAPSFFVVPYTQPGKRARLVESVLLEPRRGMPRAIAASPAASAGEGGGGDEGEGGYGGGGGARALPSGAPTVVAAKSMAGARGMTDATVGGPPSGGKRGRDAGGESAGGEDEGAAGGGASGEEEEEGDGDATLGKRIRAVVAALAGAGGALPGGAPAAPTPRAPPPAPAGSSGSLSAALAQALSASDDVGVEAVLGAGAGGAAAASGLVAATVRRLPPDCVLPLLQRLVGLLAARPSRASALLAWLRALLAAHAGYLLTLPRLVPSLEALYTLIDGRLAAHKKLLRVSGRLALLLGQVREGVRPGEAGGGGRAVRAAGGVRVALDADDASEGRADGHGEQGDDNSGEEQEEEEEEEEEDEEEEEEDGEEEEEEEEEE
jgi:hypothetical protein